MSHPSIADHVATGARPATITVQTQRATALEPTMRVRLQHTHTKADGWRLAETTVEWTGEGAPDWLEIERTLERACAQGRAEADHRNAQAAS